LPTSVLVGILVGSESDRERMQDAVDELAGRGIAHEFEVRSAHRDPLAVAEYEDRTPLEIKYTAGQSAHTLIGGDSGSGKTSFMRLLVSEWAFRPDVLVLNPQLPWGSGEGVLALMQLAKVNAAVGRLHSVGVPFFSVLTDPTFGGTAASLALLGDINIAEPGAAIGFTGPRVIKQATYADLPPGFQSAEFQLAHGQVDMVVPRTELRPLLAHLLEMYS